MGCFNQYDCNFDDASKLATPRLPEIRLFWKKSYDVIVFLCDVTNKILSRGSYCIVDMDMWTKFGSSSISTTSFL